jgi:hypothetical protein
MPFKAGGFDFPASTGAYSVTGLGFRPQAVIMFGGNRPELDTLLTNRPGPGIFISMNAVDYLDHTTVRSLFLGYSGRWTNHVANYRGLIGPISMQVDGTDAATVDYRANTISFDPDGFTLNVTKAAVGRRPIHYLAWGGPEFITGAVQQRMNGFGTTTFVNSSWMTHSELAATYPTYAALLAGEPNYNGLTAAWQPVSTFVLSTIITTAGFTEGRVQGASWLSFGSGHYPATSVTAADWAASVAFSQIDFDTPYGDVGFVGTFLESGVTQDMSQYDISHVIGPTVANEGFRRHRPDAIDSTTLINEGGGSAPFQHAVWLNGEGWTGVVSAPAAGLTSDIPAPAHLNPFGGPRGWDVMLFSTINGNAGTGGNSGQRFGFGILSPDYQGCVVMGRDGSFYQSTLDCLANCNALGAEVINGSILPTGTVRLTGVLGDGFGRTHYHGFGSPLELEAAVWVPQIYRRIRSL